MSGTGPGRRGRRRRGGTPRRALDATYRGADSIIDRGQRRAFRVLWLFLPETSIARSPRFQQIMASRFFSDAGQQAVMYGALIAVVRASGSALDAALVGVAAILPPALFSLYGGAVADALPKRVALAAAYNLQAVLCFAVPIAFGTELKSVVLLVFAVNLLGQVSGPTESAVLPLVASDRQLASAASLVSLASNLGTAFGTALLAPVLVRIFGVRPVFYISGVFLFLAASRVFDLTTRQQRRKLNWRSPNADARATVRWLLSEPAVGTMIVVAALAGTANIVIQTLAPRYVQSALHVNPADSVYVFAPSAVGLGLALLAGPLLIRLAGERVAALGGFLITAAMLGLLGFVGPNLAAALDPVNPLRLASGLGVSMSAELRTAGLLALPLGFGLSLTMLSVQTYINRRVPLSYQGRAFALQSMLKNASAIGPLLALGAAASIFGVRPVLIASPVVLLALAVALVRLSFRLSHRAQPSNLEVLATFWEEPVPSGAARRAAQEPEA